MGKSTALQEMFETEKAHSVRDIYMFVNLAQFTTDIALLREIFDHPNYEKWLQSGDDLHLFLDSLDECLIRVDTVASILGERLAAAPTDRLFLRIACRSAEWPEYLGRRLLEQFGEDSLGVYELAPLRKIDVAKEARITTSDEAGFIAQVKERNAVPMAVRPVTLRFLLNSYARSSFPANRQELYLEGCRVLCEEPDPAKRASPSLGRPDVAMRLNAATRIAAVMVFCRKSAIWSAPDFGDRPESDLAIGDLPRVEPSNVGANAIHDALTTNLFARLVRSLLAAFDAGDIFDDLSFGATCAALSGSAKYPSKSRGGRLPRGCQNRGNSMRC
jgi:hypothetical protein